MQLTARFSGEGLSLMMNQASRLAHEGRPMMAAVLNEAGAVVRKRTVDAEAKQTGLSHSTMDRAQHTTLATSGSLMFSIAAHGGDVSLKYFQPKETANGVTASPWGASRFYRGGFLKSGRPGMRLMANKLNGHVFAREGRKRLRINKLKSHLFIPTELTSGQTRAEFEAGASRLHLAFMTKLFGAVR